MRSTVTVGGGRSPLALGIFAPHETHHHQRSGSRRCLRGGVGSLLHRYRRGFDRALILQNGTFVGTFDALQKIRAGDVEGGTRRIETLCFSAANTVYSDRPPGEFVAKTFLDEFRQYRHTYRSNSAEWTVAEQNLERKLETR